MKRRFLIGLISLVFILFLIGFVSTWVDNGNSSQSVDGCNQLNTTGATYILTQNVSSNGTCFTITRPNITLDCNGYWINYSINGLENTYGVYTNQLNTTIKNCNIVDGNWTGEAAGDRRGIYLKNVNGSTIFNNYIRVNNSAAIMLEGESSFNNVTKNIAYSGLHAIDIQGHNNIISNNFANSSGVRHFYASAMIIFGGQNNILLDNVLHGRYYGLSISNFANNTFG
ncbi:MAG TPA: hypothetical protein PKZ06_02340, partial [Candidatus Pacearchaeota archaeon]|nr:hypothetical protein [Candidatus Pacearchaeota archaeon]HQI57919.1 hypothetical protein [Candidatus Pacearchaeota archaeon]